MQIASMIAPLKAQNHQKNTWHECHPSSTINKHWKHKWRKKIQNWKSIKTLNLLYCSIQPFLSTKSKNTPQSKDSAKLEKKTKNDKSGICILPYFPKRQSNSVKPNNSSNKLRTHEIKVLLQISFKNSIHT